MKILVIGKNGQLGWELTRALQPLGEVIACGRAELDMSRPQTIDGVIGNILPDFIFNASAYTAVDRAETEERLANVVNGTAVGQLAEVARKHRAKLIHYSTDYVFDGLAAAPYTEDICPNPQNAYGRSKWLGERALADVGGDAIVFRTSWVYGVRGQNFFRKIAELSLERDVLRVVSDQRGTPTPARAVADISAHSLRHVLTGDPDCVFPKGIFHLTADGETSWHTFAETIVALLKKVLGDAVRTQFVDAISTIDFGAPARRPLYSVLDCSRFDSTFGVRRPPWETALELVIGDYVR